MKRGKVYGVHGELMEVRNRDGEEMGGGKLLLSKQELCRFLGKVYYFSTLACALARVRGCRVWV